ncbi:MAG: (Fe-S)-binding protein [Anaerolineales bacterium]|nr:(Fe-S)-binding protein [Anaerolineales bacterium]
MPNPIRRVQLFATCLVETIRPQAGLAVVTVLERLGYEVEYPTAQTCCGQPAFNGGAWGEAAPMARFTVDVLSKSDAPVVVPSGSCADMIVHHYPELLVDDPVYLPRAQALAARTYEFAQFLVDVVGLKDVGGSGQGAVTYHASCHLLRGLGVRSQPRALLSHVAGVEVRELDGAEECCGFGGLFAVKMSDISGAMLKTKLDHVIASGAQTVVGCDISCLMHIEGGARKRGLPVTVCHLAELLAAQPPAGVA